MMLPSLCQKRLKLMAQMSHPLYKYLKNKLKGKLNNSIKWNFTKFLIDRNGSPF